jgi:hypothetical protein
MPVLAGTIPGITVAVSRIGFPARAAAGVARPVTFGGVLVVGGPQTVSVDAVVRGRGASAEKSALLLLVFAQMLVRIAAIVFDNVTVGDPSEQFATDPNPTKSCRVGSLVGHEPERGVVVLTSATFPAVALMAIVPGIVGVGSAVVPPEPGPS